MSEPRRCGVFAHRVQVLHQDVLVVLDAVVGAVDQPIGDLPPHRAIQRDRPIVVDPRVQLGVGVAGLGDERFTDREQPTPDPAPW